MSSESTLLFEYPYKENIRGFLRLERLFNQFQTMRLSTSGNDHLHGLKILFEILEILERGDTRSELTKELARLIQRYTLFQQSPDVDTKKLTQFLQRIEQLHQWVVAYQGKFGDPIRKHPFIQSVKHRSSIPGGSAPFDCPELYLFLQKPSAERQKKLEDWIDNIRGVETGIEVILRLIRESSHWEKQKAPMGSFIIETADRPINLVRIRMTSENSVTDKSVFPELSSGKHRSSIHFMKYDESHRKLPVASPITFELACCE